MLLSRIKLTEKEPEIARSTWGSVRIDRNGISRSFDVKIEGGREDVICFWAKNERRKSRIN